MKKSMLAMIMALMLAAPGYAAPSINGSTGLINTPSADVLREGQFSFGYYHLKDGGVGSFTMNLTGRLEVGAAGFRYDRSVTRQDHTYINAKYGLLPETILTPGVAVGVEDIANLDERTCYAAASKALPFGFRIHAGLGNGRYDGMFAVLEKTINPVSILTGNGGFPTTTLLAEWDGHNLNYGARMTIASGLKLDLGRRAHQTYFGASFTY